MRREAVVLGAQAHLDGLAFEPHFVLRDACLLAFAPSSHELPCPFVRPLRVRHRGNIVDVSGHVPGARVAKAHVAGTTWHLASESIDFLVDDASFEPVSRGGNTGAQNELRAPFNGKVIAVKAQPGKPVARGETLLVIESMKLEHALAAARDAVVKTIHIEPGQQAATSQVLVTFEPSA